MHSLTPVTRHRYLNGEWAVRSRFYFNTNLISELFYQYILLKNSWFCAHFGSTYTEEYLIYNVLICSTLKVVKRPAGLFMPWEMLAANASATWVSNARLTPGPGACTGKTVRGKAEPPITESPSTQGNPNVILLFFPRSNNLSLPPTQRNESDLNLNETSPSRVSCVRHG